MKTITLRVTCCCDCPMYDNFYYHYNNTCTILHKEITGNSSKLPSDCPLADVDKDNLPIYEYDRGGI